MEKNQYQIRGMAILEDYRKIGFGKKLLIHSEKQCIDQKVDLFWFNARTEAIGFYEKWAIKK